MNRKDTDILLALPMAYQDGLDKFNGISRCLRIRRSGRYNIHLVREKLDLAELTGFRTETYLMRLYKSRYEHTMRTR